MQIALLVTPFLVILGWIIGQDMTLHFETFETVVFFLSVLVVNCTHTSPCLVHDQRLTMSQTSFKTANQTIWRELCLLECESLLPSTPDLTRAHTAQLCYHCPCLLRLSRQYWIDRTQNASKLTSKFLNRHKFNNTTLWGLGIDFQVYPYLLHIHYVLEGWRASAERLLYIA